MDHIRERNAIPNEEDREIVANKIVVAFACVKLDSEATRVTNVLWTALAMQHC